MTLVRVASTVVPLPSFLQLVVVVVCLVVSADAAVGAGFGGRGVKGNAVVGRSGGRGLAASSGRNGRDVVGGVLHTQKRGATAKQRARLIDQVHLQRPHTGTVTVLSLLQSPYLPAYVLNAINAGLSASMYSRNSTTQSGTKIEIVMPTDDSLTARDHIDYAAKKNDKILAVLGPVGDTETLLAIPSLKRHNLVAISPLSGSSEVRQWNTHLYFLRPDPSAELLTLIRYVVTYLRVRRLGFMYLQNVSFGDAEYELTEITLSRMGYTLSGVFTVESSVAGSAEDAAFSAAWETFADT
ncbi:putative expression site-associated gene (ESAG) protein,putative, partial [Trypanosoma grayi]|uniref:putative expression site-associated gene (ESAG) protein,putative n=1 Tax=Trypanosoma grayi TaxID=71804 RepID=UPI0004F4864A